MHPRFLIGRLPGGPIAPKIPSWQLQGGAGRLPAAANAPKIPNWKASKRCRHAARSSECTQDSQLDLQGGAGRLPAAASAPKIPNSKASRRLQGGFKAVRAGCPQQRMHPRCSECTPDFQLEGFKEVRAGCPQQRMHPRLRCDPKFPIRRLQGSAGTQQRMNPRFPIERLQGGAGRVPAAATGQAARSSESTQHSQLEGLNAVRAGCRYSSECTQGSQSEGLKTVRAAVRAGCPQQRMHARF